ncbi:MAG: hypothetical protein ACJ74Z_03770 [Bryobacteraceae bacterium]
MSEEDQLKHQLRALARAVPQNANPALERRLRAAFQARVNQRRSRYVASVAAAAGVIAAGLYMAGTHLSWTHKTGADQQATVNTSVHQSSGFVALPYAQSDVPLEQPVIVRVQIPASRLGAMGMPFAHVAAEGNVDADLLVGQDGIARAVRLVDGEIQ